MLVIVLKKIYNSLIAPSAAFGKHILAVYLLSVLILLCLLVVQVNLIWIYLVFTVTFFLLIFIAYRSRTKELAIISDIINQIRNDKIGKESDIVLPKSLSSMEDEIRKMYGRIQHDIEYLRKLERVRTEFLGNVSHELKTPIFAIQGFLETLLEGAIDDEKVNRLFLEKATKHTLHLSNLVSDLIDISLIEAGEMRMSYRFFELNSFLHELDDELAHLATQKDLTLHISYLPRETNVFGDKNKLKQVFINLIQNGIKYTESGGITVSTALVNKLVKISIKDTGNGIAAEHLPRIFERFYRVDKARSKSAGGTGLGLAIVKHILEAHETKIEVSSELGKGSEFTFFLKR